MHRSGDAKSCLDDFTWTKRGDAKYDKSQAYCDSKLQNVWLTKAVASRWPDVQSSCLDPGWMPTKMAPGAPGDLKTAVATYVDLAEGGNGKKSGGYYAKSKEEKAVDAAGDTSLQDRYMRICGELTGVAFPA